MDIEIEIKVKCHDIGNIESKLIKLGFKERGIFTQKDIYFQHPSRDFAMTDEALRIRIQDNATYMTYKGPKIGSLGKSRREIKVKVDNAENLTKILRELGFKPVKEIFKIRKIYKKGPISVNIDNVRGLGTFLEIETHERGDISELEKKLLELTNKLGLKGKPIRKSYLELLLEMDKH